MGLKKLKGRFRINKNIHTYRRARVQVVEGAPTAEVTCSGLLI